MHDGWKKYSLSRSGEDWSSSGAKMDANSVRTLVDKIRDLSASKFADGGFTSAILDMTVTSNDGKRVEKVLIAKNGDRYVAKRENEPALYDLNAPNVTPPQNSPPALTPPPPPK